MAKLTEHQAKALGLFPSEGWHRVDNVPLFWLWVRRNRYTADILEQKGYLEFRVKPDKWKYSFELYREYKKLPPKGEYETLLPG